MIYHILLSKDKFSKQQLFKFIRLNNVQPLRITRINNEYNIKVNNIDKKDKQKLKTIMILGCIKLKYL